jgi:hypothetical protein
VTAFQSSFHRLELKYLVDEGTAARVRQQIAPYCKRDRNVPGGRSRDYPVESLYLDTPSLAFHRAKEMGDPERFKLRLRRYWNSDSVCVELKRRTCDVVEKTRALVAAADVCDVAHGRGKLRDEGSEARAFLDRFARLVLETGAEPSLLVRYDREAYSSEVDSYARVTFDRNVEFQRTGSWSFDGASDAWLPLQDYVVEEAPNPLVVLELKCQVAVPFWLLDVIRTHDLRRDSLSKYSIGIYLARRLEGYCRGSERARGVFR